MPEGTPSGGACTMRGSRSFSASRTRTCALPLLRTRARLALTLAFTFRRYAYNQFQKERVPGDDTVEGWHGTGTFPAENIYNDRQDGASLAARQL